MTKNDKKTSKSSVVPKGKKEEKSTHGNAKPVDLKRAAVLCAQFNTMDDIAADLNLDEATVLRGIREAGYVGFKDFFNKHSAKGRISLKAAQFRVATEKDDPRMLIFLGKNYLGQADKVETIVTDVAKLQEQAEQKEFVENNTILAKDFIEFIEFKNRQKN